MYELTTSLPFILVAYPGFILLILFAIRKICWKEHKDVQMIFGKEETDFLRGIAACMVLFTHLSQKLVNPSLMYWYWFFGYLSVGFFLFISGYSSYVSYQKKGKGMFRRYLPKRLLRLYLPFLIINTIYALCFRITCINYIKGLLFLRMVIENEIEAIEPAWFLVVMFYLAITFFYPSDFWKKRKPGYCLHSYLWDIS